MRSCDLVEKKVVLWDGSLLGANYREEPIADDLMEVMEQYREQLLEVLSETDDTFMERYLSEETVSAAEIKSVLRRATLNLHVVPVLTLT